MKIEKGYQSETEMESRVMLANTVNFDSCFKFIAEHNGWREKNIHILLGATSSGKSTLVRSLIVDAITSGMVVLLWLSEEKIDTFKTEIAFLRMSHEKFNNLILVSEQDGAGKGGFIKTIKKLINDFEPDLFVLDNLTTSRFYGSKRPNEQDDILNALKDVISDASIAGLLVCHTSSSVSTNSRKIVNESDVRGTRTVSNISEFFYILQKFRLTQNVPTYGNQISTIRVLKHRGQTMVSTIYLLEYFPEQRLLGNDKPVDYERFKTFIDRAVDL